MEEKRRVTFSGQEKSLTFSLASGKKEKEKRK